MNHYQVLGISRDATSLEIKKIYKNLAKIYHPDINNNSHAEVRFKEIQNAYDTLSNDYERKLYDQDLERQENEIFQEQEKKNYYYEQQEYNTNYTDEEVETIELKLFEKLVKTSMILFLVNIFLYIIFIIIYYIILVIDSQSQILWINLPDVEQEKLGLILMVLLLVLCIVSFVLSAIGFKKAGEAALLNGGYTPKILLFRILNGLIYFMYIIALLLFIIIFFIIRYVVKD